jgi:hypothetical protein
MLAPCAIREVWLPKRHWGDDDSRSRPRHSEAAERLLVTQAIRGPDSKARRTLVPNVSPEVLRSGDYVNT